MSWGRIKHETVVTVPTPNLEPYIEIERVRYWKWRIDLYEPTGLSYNPHRYVAYWNRYSAPSAKRKAIKEAQKAQDRYNWARNPVRIDARGKVK